MSVVSFDPQRAVRRAHKRVRRTEAEVADRLARLADRAPARAIEELMRAPTRHLVVGAIFSQMPARIDRERAAGMDVTVRWRVGDEGGGDRAGVYDLVIKDGRASVHHAPSCARQPRLTIALSPAELLAIATGKSDPMQAYFNRRLTLSGDIMLAAKLASMFRMPARRAR